MTLKLLQDIGVLNVNVLFTFLNVYTLDSNNDSQHSHRISWYFLTPIAKFRFSQQLFKVGGCGLLLTSLMLSNPGTLFLLIH